MIKVERLTKRYGSVTAVDAIDFEVEKGRSSGCWAPMARARAPRCECWPATFRPPLGALKWLDATSLKTHSGRGSISATCRSTSRCRTTCGSTNISPFARLSKVFPDVESRNVWRMSLIFVAWREVERKMISALSKGFRQRVGLADAMIHEPELLILDEPTIGLDPNQIRQVRELIKNLRRHHTILLSTHILSGSGDDLFACHHHQQGPHRGS